jgi:endonuclease YncB( thermonuclease family)
MIDERLHDGGCGIRSVVTAMRKTMLAVGCALVGVMGLAGCEGLVVGEGGGGSGEVGRVTRVIDGDTIDVDLDGEIVRVRYLGANTPERDEPCYSDAVRANRELVEGETVRLVMDTTDTDRFDRLLRYVYVGDTLVNGELVRQGFAEVVLYEPDGRFYETFLQYERDARRNRLGCHPTGIFEDGSDRR